MTDENTASAAASLSPAQDQPTTPAKKRGRPKRPPLCGPAMEPVDIRFSSADSPAPAVQSESTNDNQSESEENPGMIAATAC